MREYSLPRRKYIFAKAMLIFYSIIGWLFLLSGVVVAVYLIFNQLWSELLISLGLVIFGVLILAFVQMVMAQIATAENTYAIYDLVKTNLPGNSHVTNASFKKTVRSTANLQEDMGRIKMYKGKEILKTREGIVVDGEIFATVIEAEKWIAAQNTE